MCETNEQNGTDDLEDLLYIKILSTQYKENISYQLPSGMEGSLAASWDRLMMSNLGLIEAFYLCISREIEKKSFVYSMNTWVVRVKSLEK